MHLELSPAARQTRSRAAIPWVLLTALLTMPAAASDFGGEWRTSFGTASLKQAGDHVAGTYGEGATFTLEGNVAGDTLTFEYQEGPARGSGQWVLDKSTLSFHGSFQVQGGRAGEWEGWRPDPKAPEAPRRADVSGLWLTDLGLMELAQ